MESVWIRLKGQANTGDITVCIYYRLPDKEEEVEVDEGPSTSNRKQPQNHRHLFSGGTSFILSFAGKQHPQAHTVQGAPGLLTISGVR